MRKAIGRRTMANLRRRFGDDKVVVELRVRRGAATPVAKAFVASTGEPVLVKGAPVEMPGGDDGSALESAIRSVERVYGKIVKPKARKRKGKK
jgi:hypothetical protein